MAADDAATGTWIDASDLAFPLPAGTKIRLLCVPPVLVGRARFERLLACARVVAALRDDNPYLEDGSVFGSDGRFLDRHDDLPDLQPGDLDPLP